MRLESLVVERCLSAEPTSKRGHDLEVIQSNFVSQKKTFEKDGLNATKITSVLADAYMLGAWCVVVYLQILTPVALSMSSVLQMKASFRNKIPKFTFMLNSCTSRYPTHSSVISNTHACVSPQPSG